MDDATHYLTELLTPLADWLALPVYWLLIGALLLGGLIAHLVVHKLFVGAESAIQNTRTPWDDIVIRAASQPGGWALWLIILYVALGFPGNLEGLRDWLRQVADTGFILLLGWFLQRLMTGVEEELLSDHRGPRESDDRAAISATVRLLRISLWIVVVLMILQSLGVSVSGLLAFGGIGGIAVGFAARDLLANFLGGVSIYLDRPFTVGDWIRSPDREIEGTVEHIGWRVTCIRTFDQRPLYVPNAVFATVAIENPTRMRNRRIYETFGIRYSDGAQMAAIVADVKQMLTQHEAIDLERTLIVNFVTCGPSSLDFFIYTFTKTRDWVEYHGIKQDVLLRVLAIIEQHGAEVAFPTRTLYLSEGEEPAELPRSH